MKDTSPQKITLIGTLIAIELARDKSLSELNTIKNILCQLQTSLSTIITQKTINKIDKKD